VVEKAKKVAFIACMRKLPTTLNAMLTDRALVEGTASVRWTVKTVADTFSFPTVLRNPEREMRAGGDQQDTLGREKSGPLPMMALLRVPGLVPAP